MGGQPAPPLVDLMPNRPRYPACFRFKSEVLRTGVSRVVKGQWVCHQISKQIMRVVENPGAGAGAFVWCEWLDDSYHVTAANEAQLDVVPQNDWPGPGLIAALDKNTPPPGGSIA